MSITRLMQMNPMDWELCDIRDALQSAIELEFSTIPLYLFAMWSVKDTNDPVYGMLGDIVQQEMLHMGLACNILTTIGGTPEIASPRAVPVYPGRLPGGVREDLTVYLQGLTRQTVREIFMEIEYPEANPAAFFPPRTGFTSIGEFYDAVLDAFRYPGIVFTGERQRTTDYFSELIAINSLADVETAITVIKDQGEGTSMSPLDLEPGMEFAHYYRFAEIYQGKLLSQDGSGNWYFDDAKPLPFPAVYPAARVPAGGYPSTIPEVLDFDAKYSSILFQLESAWTTTDDNAGQTYLSNAITAMPSLCGPAVALMRMPLDGGDFTYGPCFRFVGCSC
jgi:hypothetical protein